MLYSCPDTDKANDSSREIQYCWVMGISNTVMYIFNVDKESCNAVSSSNDSSGHKRTNGAQNALIADPNELLLFNSCRYR